MTGFSDLSLLDKGRFALGKLGVPQTIEAHYPSVARPFRVQFHQLWRMIESGTWEPERLKAAMMLCKQGQTIIDCGAFIGAYSLLFAHLVGPSGKVFSIECDPRPERMLATNRELNGFGNIFILPLRLDFHATIDSLNLKRIDGIKIDVEESSNLALEGAKDTIRRSHPWIIFEAHPQLGLPMPEFEKDWNVTQLDSFGFLIKT